MSMRVLAFILSVYLIFLVAVPCCSFDNCPEDKSEQTANHETGDEDCGSCSPFFSCSGCIGTTLSLYNSSFEIVLLISGHQYPGYILSSIPETHFDFWQPPKLG